MGMIGRMFSPTAWKNRLRQWKRAIDVSTKPDKEEFMSASKITAAGMLLIGAIGFFIFLVYQLLVVGV